LSSLNESGERTLQYAEEGKGTVQISRSLLWNDKQDSEIFVNVYVEGPRPCCGPIEISIQDFPLGLEIGKSV
jgi:hypothetical protein